MAKISDENEDSLTNKAEESVDEDMDSTISDVASTDAENKVETLDQPRTTQLSQNHMMIVVGLLALCAIVIAYFWMSSTDKGAPSNLNGAPLGGGAKPQKSGAIPVPVLQTSSQAPSTAQAIAPPPLPKPVPINFPKSTAATATAGPAPLAMNAPPSSMSAPPFKTKAEALKKQELEKQNRQNAKIKSSIMLTGGGGAAQSQGGSTKDDKNTLDASGADGTFNPSLTAASTTKVTKIGDMSTTITQGKIMDSVLETPINTLHPGPIRGLISRDVFSEQGANVLIPKGSRIIGALTGGYTPGSTRIGISWNRIILPSGYDITIAQAPGVNKLGSLGIEGFVDRQFMEIIGSVAMFTLINITASKIVEDAFNIKPSTSVTSSGTNGTVKTTDNLTPAQKAAKDGFSKIDDSVQSWLKQNFAPKPYVVVDQGTRIKIFVNQDVRFPKNLSGANIVK